jgi:putative addiction module component (TIGR02574 family)
MNQGTIVSEFDGLSHEEKGELLDLLWDRYQQEEQRREATSEERAELNRRLQELREDPSAARPVADVHRELRASLLEG